MIKFTLAIEVGDPDELGRWLGRVLAAAEQGVHDGKAKQGAPAPAGPPAAPGAKEPKVDAVVRAAGGKGETGEDLPRGRDGGAADVRRPDVPVSELPGPARRGKSSADYSKVGNFRKLITAVQADGAKTVDEIFAVLQGVHAAGTCPVLRVIEAEDLEDRVRSACELMGI